MTRTNDDYYIESKRIRNEVLTIIDQYAFENKIGELEKGTPL